ncbi:MAG: ATP synthase F1 subunit delta [Nitrospiraceae bacterium]|nr:ATP synthase F1 subunit delta [Nitrospiraceae bacterium]
MKPVKQAKKYAKTFMSVVGVEEMPKALVELGAVETLMQKSMEFRSLLVNPGFSGAERTKALQQVAAKAGLSDKVVKFVMHLTEIRVIAALSDILKIATALYLERMKRAKAVVMTPVEVSKNYEERLKASLKKMIEREIDIEYVIDASLLGGVLVKVGSTMYDSSVKGQLRLLKDELIKG